MKIPLSERRILRVAAYLAENPITEEEMNQGLVPPVFPSDHPYSYHSIMRRDPRILETH